MPSNTASPVGLSNRKESFAQRVVRVNVSEPPEPEDPALQIPVNVSSTAGIFVSLRIFRILSWLSSIPASPRTIDLIVSMFFYWIATSNFSTTKAGWLSPY